MSFAPYTLELDARGGARDISPDEWIDAGDRHVWIHLDRSSEECVAWLRDRSGIDPVAAQALQDSRTRPRWSAFDSGIVVNLRGINMEPDADPEDLVSMRFWLEKKRIITVRRERILAADDVVEQLRKSKGPRTAPEVFVHLADRLVSRLAPVIEFVDDALDDLEDRVVDPDIPVTRREVAPLRQQIIALRRYLAPQREALETLVSANHDLFDHRGRTRLREIANRMTRYVEDIDSSRDRVAVIYDELSGEQTERLNERMYLVTVIAAVFLPLTFITGLLGINVGGIPGSTSPLAFWIVAALLVALGVGSLVVLRRRRWF